MLTLATGRSALAAARHARIVRVEIFLAFFFDDIVNAVRLADVVVQHLVRGWLVGHVACGHRLQVLLLFVVWCRHQLHLVTVVLLLLVVLFFLLLESIIIEYLVAILSRLVLKITMQLLSLRQLEQFERLPVLLAHIIGSCKAIEVVNEMQHLLISLVVIEWNDWDAVIDLECETIDTVVDDHYVL